MFPKPMGTFVALSLLSAVADPGAALPKEPYGKSIIVTWGEHRIQRRFGEPNFRDWWFVCPRENRRVRLLYPVPSSRSQAFRLVACASACLRLTAGVGYREGNKAGAENQSYARRRCSVARQASEQTNPNAMGHLSPVDDAISGGRAGSK